MNTATSPRQISSKESGGFIQDGHVSPSRGRNTFLLVWAICSTVGAISFAILALVCSNRELETRRRYSSPFLTLEERDVVGRYRFVEQGMDAGFIQLLANHSFINRDGTTFPQYHWEISRDGLVTVWSKGTVIYRVIERPGVYVALHEDGTEFRRIQKVE